jgi:membrane protease YdiL (CAAX protease family)
MIPSSKYRRIEDQRSTLEEIGQHKPGCPNHTTFLSSLKWASRDCASTFFFVTSNLDPPHNRSQSDVPAVNQILPEGEAILQPPMDNTPNDAPDDPPTRIPNLGHALLFLAIAGLLLILTQLILLPLTHTTLAAGKASVPPKLLIASEAVTYLATIAISWFLFALLWKRPFAEGIQANPDASRRNAFKLIPVGVALSLLVQAASSLATLPKNIPMDDFFRTPSDVWLIAIFGTLLAPLFEEITFRGFLLPAFAIAYDWLALPRTEAARDLWNSSNKISRPAWVFSAVLTSIFFAAVHGQQVAYTWPVLLLLFCVSLVLSVVRLHLRSVLASTLIHASYNFTIFFTAFLATDGYRHLDKMGR